MDQEQDATKKSREEIIAERDQRLTDRIMGTLDAILFPIAIAGMISLPYLPKEATQTIDNISNYNSTQEQRQDNYSHPAGQKRLSSSLVYEKDDNPFKR